jgi:two-component system CheB/CheR fusion protein
LPPARTGAEQAGEGQDMKDQAAGDLTIIGIGSSAGGLEAIRELVVTLPSDLPVTYVVVQHMSPHHKSLMTELVARETDLKVRSVVDGTVPEANVIYITPPKNDVIFEEGALRLREPSRDPARPKPSVNRFLLSLAENHGERSMAIILSGTGSDGAYGVQAIREVGGITIAQDTESAKYDGMPYAALQTGCVDLVLRPLEIGNLLAKILNSPRDFADARKTAQHENPHSDLMQILLAKTRVDFREYKQTTVGCRIERRMVALGIKSTEEYTQFCRSHPEAVDALFKDLLISVTRFFRDKAEFDHLAERLPELLKQRGDHPFRVWIAGCATGEEAYTIAMLLSEALGGPGNDLRNRVQIFATDIDKNALAIARRGVYGAAALDDIPRDLAEKYLIRESDGIRVIDPLRAAILFSDHNVCQDPPFQRIDLICCRNLLIYFGTSLQQRVLSRFHYALVDGGTMLLGTAESVAGSDDLFTQDRRSGHIYHKRRLSQSPSLSYSMPNLGFTARALRPPAPKPQTPSTDRQMLDGLISALGENSILLADDYSIIRVNGTITRYIEINAKSSLKGSIDLLRSPLREEARSLVTIALKTESPRSGVRHLLAEDDANRVRLDVYPIVAREISERAALVVFTPVEEQQPRPRTEAEVVKADSAEAERIRDLETEVASTREALQQTIEELETSNEELQSLNEELQSTNEELQAANEELETSNEELQSTNEELITVNEELQVTTTELTGKSGELESVLRTAPVPILVVDHACQITQATKPAIALFKLREPILSPHISQCDLPDGYPALAPLCSEALQMGTAVHSEFASGDNRVRLSCSPYFEDESKIRGVTVAITEFPGLSGEMEMILQTESVFILHRDREGTILRISEAFARALGASKEAATGRNIAELFDGETARRMLERDAQFLRTGEGARQELIEIPGQCGHGPMWLNLNRFHFMRKAGGDRTIYSIATDVTATVSARREAELHLKEMKALQDFAGVGYWEVDLLADTVTWTEEVHRIHRTTPETHSPDLATGIGFYHPEDVADVTACVNRVVEEGGEFEFVKRLNCADGSTIKVASHGMGVRDETGRVVKITGFFREVAEAEGLALT